MKKFQKVKLKVSNRTERGVIRGGNKNNTRVVGSCIPSITYFGITFF